MQQAPFPRQLLPQFVHSAAHALAGPRHWSGPQHGQAYVPHVASMSSPASYGGAPASAGWEPESTGGVVVASYGGEASATVASSGVVASSTWIGGLRIPPSPTGPAPTSLDASSGTKVISGTAAHPANAANTGGSPRTTKQRRRATPTLNSTASPPRLSKPALLASLFFAILRFLARARERPGYRGTGPFDYLRAPWRPRSQCTGPRSSLSRAPAPRSLRSSRFPDVRRRRFPSPLRRSDKGRSRSTACRTSSRRRSSREAR